MRPMTNNVSNPQRLLLPPLLNEREVAEMTGMSVATVRRWRLMAKGPRYVKVGGVAVRYYSTDIESWLSSQPSGGQRIEKVH